MPSPLRARRGTAPDARRRRPPLQQRNAVLARQNAALVREVARLRQLNRHILTGDEDQRMKMSRQLHEDVQNLVGVNIALATLGKGASLGFHDLTSRIARTRRLVEASVSGLLRFARDLRPAGLDDLGLIPALHAYTLRVAAHRKFKIRLTAFGGVEALGPLKRTVLFRVAQEALAGIARHAEATQVRMSITQMVGTVRMEISDNGRSFGVDRALTTRNRNRLGLVGMKARVEMVGGSLAIFSTAGVGTTVRADIPFKPKSADRRVPRGR